MVNFNDFNAIFQREHNTSSLQNLSAAVSASVNALNGAATVPVDYSDAYAGVALLTTDDNGDVVDQTTSERKSIPDSILAKARHDLATTRDSVKGRYGQAVLAVQADYQLHTAGEVNKFHLDYEAPMAQVLTPGQVVFHGRELLPVAGDEYDYEVENRYELRIKENGTDPVQIVGTFDTDGYFSGIIRFNVQLWRLYNTGSTTWQLVTDRLWLTIPVFRHTGEYTGIPDFEHIGYTYNVRMWASGMVNNSNPEVNGANSRGWLAIPSINYSVLRQSTPKPFRDSGIQAAWEPLPSPIPVANAPSPGAIEASNVITDGARPSMEIKVEDIVTDLMQDIDDAIDFLDGSIPE